MRLVSDGETYGILQRSGGEECRIRALPEGTMTTRPCSELSAVDPSEFADWLGVTAGDSGSRDRAERALALVLELAVGGPASARQLLDRFDACESELNGTASELRAAGLIVPTTVYGQRGYRTTDAAQDAIAADGTPVPSDLD
ncbi:Transcriptional regulator, HTH domain [Halapricum desulfuricans]|uniref:Transcriptional regulator, HTH domain n=1 Tax=Halapricum desulfuricans TaxID=2841257 RepID=A0A897NFT4_9EURY|nr:hypothetical protein [Halapricum desulfuricans]QSG11438.1 Transcriptional regulator, HTH domain [Halapricum desulfuricans]